MRFIAIGGEPATGKTTLVNSIRAYYKLHQKAYKKILNYEMCQRDSLIILGKYSGDKFDGTDRLSMGVQPVAELFIKEKARTNPGKVVLFEGDRLFNMKYLTFLRSKSEVIVIVLVVDKDTKEFRHSDRDDTQSEVFLKGRKTKINNIARSLPVVIWKNKDKIDLIRNKRNLLKIIKGFSYEKIKMTGIGDVDIDNKKSIRKIFG